MCRTFTASLAVIAALATLRIAHFAQAVGPLSKPISVRFQLVDGVRVSGEMTGCDDEGFDGSFGRRLWTELDADDAWNLHQRVMDAQSAHDWVNLGRVMLALAPAQKRAAGRAETAFNRALKIDPKVDEEITSAKEEAAARERDAKKARREAEENKLTTVSPEGRPWVADPWPALTDDEQAAAVLAIKSDGQRILQQASASIEPMETDHFILYSELERAQSAEWAVRLERVVTGLEVILNPGVDPAAKNKPIELHPWGKVAVFIWREHDRFKMAEAETFRHLVPNAAVAVCHFSGPRAFINAWRIEDEESFEWSLRIETVHALLHHCRTPKRLPAWANEGLGEMIASKANKYSNLGHDRRKQALEFIRNGGSVNAVMDLKYEDSSWPGPSGIGPPVGGLVVELMMNQKPQRIAQWIMAVKGGKDWVAALKDDYGTSREEIINIATQYYKVND